MQNQLLTTLLIFASSLAASFTSDAAPVPAKLWPIGAASVDITPNYPVRLSGYGNRRTEHEGVEQHIFAKALAIGSDAEGVAVIVTVDNVGVPGKLREEVLKRLVAKTKLAPERFAVCSSHTHCAPMLLGVLPNLFSMDIPTEHLPNIQRYTRELTDKIEQVVLAALAKREPCKLAWGSGHVSFAHNRRAFAFRPEDHSLPVLRAVGADGKVRAVFTSYACHCTTLSFNRVHGDWAGCAQEFLEKAFPGAVALTALGCGADQNPNPRGTYELAREYGDALGAEVKRLAASSLKPVTGKLECRTKQISLPFDSLPTRDEWVRKAKDKATNTAYHAKKNLERLERGESLPTALPYLVQVWNFGSELALVFLPGEVVVDYSLRLKRELDSERLWVNAYANDVPCYIPSARVLAEGGYEGATAMMYYDRPTKFAPGIEELIIGAVHELLPQPFQRSH